MGKTRLSVRCLAPFKQLKKKIVSIQFFANLYHDRGEKKNQLFEEKNQVEFSLKNQSSQHSTVEIDGKNNSRFSSLKSENKHSMLNTSEQDLNSSYLETQDSEAEAPTKVLVEKTQEFSRSESES